MQGVDQETFRRCVGCFSTGVTVVTTHQGEKHYGVTINSFASLSLEPPLILFSLDNASRHMPVFSAAQTLIVNVLSEEQFSLSEHFASHNDAGWKNIAYRDGTLISACRVLENAAAHLECHVETRHEGGDHTLFICRVLQAHSDEARSPLLYYRGRYCTLGALHPNETRK